MGTFGKAYRFTSKKEIDSAFKFSRKKDSHSFRLFKSINETSSHNKFAVIISKRSGNAVVRNRCKRKVREWLRLNQMNLNSDFHHIIFIKQNITMHSFSKMDQELSKLMVQSNHQRKTYD